MSASSTQNENIDENTAQPEAPIDTGAGTKESEAPKDSKEAEKQIDFKTLLYIKQLETKVSDYEKKVGDIREYVRKMEDEIQQIRIRADRDGEKNLNSKLGGFFSNLLPVVDDFERSLKVSEKESGVLAEGFRLIYQRFSEFLSRAELVRIPTKDVAFDPQLHDAIVTQPVSTSALDGKIIEEVQAGYKYKESVIRPAQVVVGQFN